VFKTSQDLNDFSRNLKRTTFEAVLNAETSECELNLYTPRDHNGSYKFYSFKNIKFRFTCKYSKTRWLYAQSISIRQIAQAFYDCDGADILRTFVKRMTNAVIDKVVECQSRLLDPIHSVIYLDCFVIKVRQDARDINALSS
jgi:putative transposase